MDLSATDVENREFAEGRKGYVREDVDRFLDEVAAQFRRYEERFGAMAQRVTALETQLAESRETEDMARRTLLVAHRAADDAVKEAEQRATSLLQAAEQKASSLEDDVRRRRAALEADIEALRRFEAEFRTQVRQALEAQLALLQRTGRSAAEAPAPAGPVATIGHMPEREQVPPPGQMAAPGGVLRPPAGTPRPTTIPPGPHPGPPPVRVADNEVLRRLTETGRPDPSQDR